MPGDKKTDISSGKPLSERISRTEGPPPPPVTQANNPLHGVKLADMLEYLVAHYGWPELGSMINIRCFNYDPSVKSSLAFLRKTPWARDKVEKLYLNTVANRNRK